MRKGLWLVEPDLWDADHVIADLDAIRQYNPQRFEMEQLTAVIYEDTSRHICIGYKDIGVNEFWVRGHMPYAPAMPMALMCEVAGQLANYYALKHRLYAAQGGFVGMKNVRCRQIVRPGERLFVMVKLLKIRSAVLTCRFQCVVRKRLVCDGVLMGGVFSWSNGQRHGLLE
jgi:3-hydroxyacyl-[acyl-carrier-protein] dehydratase